MGNSDDSTRACEPYKFGPEARARFLEAMEKSGLVYFSAKAAGVARSTVYLHRDQDPEFAAAWKEAHEAFCDGLEQEAYRRAVDGVETPIFDKHGEEVGSRVQYSDSLLSLLLKRHKPDDYRERVSVAGEDGSPLKTVIEIRYVKSECAPKSEP